MWIGFWGREDGGRAGRPFLHSSQGQTGYKTKLGSFHLELPIEVQLRRRNQKGQKPPGDWQEEQGHERGWPSSLRMSPAPMGNRQSEEESLDCRGVFPEKIEAWTPGWVSQSRALKPRTVVHATSSSERQPACFCSLGKPEQVKDNVTVFVSF